jgi:putative Ca2+/H+ antiporter (TMEM165/GDT1 family)
VRVYVRARGDRGTGLVASFAGLTVVILFMTFAAQVLLSLYATSTVRATLHDAASRAADQRTGQPNLGALAAQAEASLGEMGDRTSITLQLLDDDGDGAADIVLGHAVAIPPRVVPPSIGGMIGFDHIDVSVRVRIERLR